MQISASVNVVDRNVLARSTDAKPHAAYGVYERIGMLTVDLAANAADIDIDDVSRRVKMKIPDMLQQHRAGYDMAFVANEVFENLKLSRQKFDFSATAIHRSRSIQEIRQITIKLTHRRIRPARVIA